VCPQDASESDTDYKLQIDLPGFDAEDIDIELQDGKLTVSAQKQDGQAKEGVKVRDDAATRAESGSTCYFV
jgi:HSP20 family molecular chaperone IbpA